MKKNTDKKNNKGMSKGKMIAVGAGLAAVGAGAYALLGPSGKKNRAKVRAFAKKMEKQARPQIKKMEKMGRALGKQAIPKIEKIEKKAHKTLKVLKKKIK